MKMAARPNDNVVHPLSPILGPGPGSVTVFIGGLPAWRGIPSAAVGALQAMKKASEIRIKAAEASAMAAMGTPGAPAAKAAEQALKAVEGAAMAGAIMSGAMGADIHNCTTPLVAPPHGPGIVIDGSKTVFINGLPAARAQDTILEALGPTNKIVRGMFNFFIGD
jgi:uncharacterized Zn-binding protein involved in type VI secretion